MSDHTPRYVPFTAPATPEKKKEEKPKKPQEKKEEKKKEEKPKKPQEKKEEKKKEEKPKKPQEKIMPKKEKPEKIKAPEVSKEAPKKLKEVKEPKKAPSEEIKTYTWQMVGTDYQIMMADSKGILVALMLDSAPSEPIKASLLKFAQGFENKFKTEIENFRGNVQWFRPAIEIADDAFNMFLMQPQCLPVTSEELETIQFTPTEDKIVKQAQKLCKDTSYFFLAMLLDELIKEYNIPRENILKAFFNLHRKKAFLPISIEEVGKEVEKRKLWQQVSGIYGLTKEEYDVLMDDLLVSNDESRNTLLAKVQEFKKKTRGIQLREEVAKRRRIRKERDEYFKQIDELLKANDYNEVFNTFNNIIRLSKELGENTIAQELTQRSQSYSQEINQTAQRIPELRSQRSEALNQAEMSELSGNYLQAAEQFAVAAELSAEIGEYDKAKDYVNQAERLKGLSELAKLRERLR